MAATLPGVGILTPPTVAPPTSGASSAPDLGTQPAPGTPPTPAFLSQAIASEAQNQGIDPEFAMRVATQESHLDPTANSGAGARGIFQLMPGTAQDLGVNPNDPMDNIRGGIKYLKQLHDRYQDPMLTAAAYNAGPGTVDDYLNGTNNTGKNPNKLMTGGLPPFPETEGYVSKVLSKYAGTGATGPSSIEVPPSVAPPAGGSAPASGSMSGWDVPKATALAVTGVAQGLATFFNLPQGTEVGEMTQGGALDALTGATTGTTATDALTNLSQNIVKTMTPRAQAALQKTWTTTDTGKAAWADPVSWTLGAAQMVPFVAANAVTAIKTAAEASTALKAAGLTGTALKTAVARRTMGAVAAVNVPLSGLPAMGDAKAKVMAMTPQELEADPLYNQLLDRGLSPADAKSTMADAASSVTGLVAGASGAVGGVGFGHILSNKISGVLGKVVVGALSGAEFNAGQQAAQNVGVNLGADPNQSLTQGVGEAAAQGAAFGGVLSGAHHLLFGRGQAQAKPNAAPDFNHPTASDEPPPPPDAPTDLTGNGAQGTPETPPTAAPSEPTDMTGKGAPAPTAAAAPTAEELQPQWRAPFNRATGSFLKEGTATHLFRKATEGITSTQDLVTRLQQGLASGDMNGVKVPENGVRAEAIQKWLTELNQGESNESHPAGQSDTQLQPGGGNGADIPDNLGGKPGNGDAGVPGGSDGTGAPAGAEPQSAAPAGAAEDRPAVPGSGVGDEKQKVTVQGRLNDLHDQLQELSDYHEDEDVRNRAQEHLESVEGHLFNGTDPRELLNTPEGKTALKFADKHYPDMMRDSDYQESRLPKEERDQLKREAVDRVLDEKLGGERSSTKRASSVLEHVLDTVRKGKATSAYLESQIGRLLQDHALRTTRKEVSGMSRRRGADIIVERMAAAVRKGEIDRTVASTAEWFVRRNPGLVSNLGISVRNLRGREIGSNAQGFYDAANRVIHLIKGGVLARAGLHEILHHLERMLPPEAQDEVRKAWTRAVVKELQTAAGSRRKYLEAALAAHFARDDGAKKLQAQLLNQAGALKTGDYKFMNPSEYWAETMSEKLLGRFNAKDSLMKKSALWLRGLFEHVKHLLGMQSDHPLTKNLDDVLRRGDSTPMSPGALDSFGPRGEATGGKIPRGLGFDMGTDHQGQIEKPYSMTAQQVIELAKQGTKAAAALREHLVSQGHDGLEISGAGNPVYVSFGDTQARNEMMASRLIPKSPEEAGNLIGSAVQEAGAKPAFLRSLFSRGADVKDLGDQGLLYSMMNNQIANSIEGMRMKSLQLFTKLKGLQGMDKRQFLRPVADLDSAIQALKPADRAAWEWLEREATTTQIWPDRGLDHPDNAHVEDKEAYAKVSQAYNDLSPQAKAVWQQARTLFSDQLAEKMRIHTQILDDAEKRSVGHQNEVMKDAVLRGDTAGAQKAKDAADKIQSGFDARRKEMMDKVSTMRGPYSPNMRFGKFIVVARSKALKAVEDQLDAGTGSTKSLKVARDRMRQDERHYVVTSDERLSDAQARADDLRRRGYDTRSPALAREYLGRQTGMRSIVADMQEYAAHLEPGVRDQMLDMLGEFAARDLPEHHALLRQMRRENVPGASNHAARSVITAAQRNAHYMAVLKYAPQLAEAVRGMKEEAKALDQMHDTVHYERIAQEMERRHLLDTGYQSTWADAVVSGVNNLSFFYHLGLSPGFMVQQVLQPTMLTLPQLAGKFGVMRSEFAMRKAYREATRLIVQSAKTRGDTRSLMNFDVKFNLHQGPDRTGSVATKYSEERAALQYLQDHGALDMGREHDFSLTTEGNSPAMSKFKQLSAWLPHYTEILNRLVTGLAAYRLAREGGLGHDEATDYAHKMIDLTQINYSDENLPRMMRPGGGGGAPIKMAMQFRRFQQAMVYLSLKNFKDSFSKQLSPEDRGIARRAMIGQTIMMTLAGGLLATPFAFPAKALVSLLSGAFDEHMSMDQVEVHFRNWLVDVTGNAALARALSKGLPTMLGADISGQVGVGDVLNPLPYSNVDTSKPNDILPELLMAVGGAPVGMVNDWIVGLSELANGNWKGGLAKLIPLKGADNLIKAQQLATEGLTNQQGVTTVPADKFSKADVGMRAAGVTSTAVGEHYQEQRAKTEILNNAKAAKTDILNEVLRSTSRGGPALPDGTAKKIQEFNDKYAVATGEKLTASDVVRAVMAQRKAAVEQDDAGVAYNPNQQQMKPIGRFAR